MRRLCFVVLLGGCKVQLADAPDDAARFSSDGGATIVDALPAWGTPTKHPSASSLTLAEDDGSLRRDGLEMVFATANEADANRKDLYSTSRASLADAWTPPVLLSFSVTGASDETPRFSTDGLTLYFASGRPGGAGSLDIYAVRRTSLTAAWGAPSAVVGVNSTALEKWYTPCGGRYLVNVGTEIAEGEIGEAPTIVAALSVASASETGPFLTEDCLTTYFASTRGDGTNRLYIAQRASATAAWDPPALFDEFAGVGGDQEDPWISPDGTLFSFASNVAGTKDQYIVTRP